MSDSESTQVSPAKKIVHEGPSVSVPASEIKFIDTGVKTEKGELRAGLAYGDLQNGRHGTFVRMPAGFKSPVHTHTEDYYAVVVEGLAPTILRMARQFRSRLALTGFSEVKKRT